MKLYFTLKSRSKMDYLGRKQQKAAFAVNIIKKKKD